MVDILRRRIDDLERRMDHVERKLAIEPAAAPAARQRREPTVQRRPWAENRQPPADAPRAAIPVGPAPATQERAVIEEIPPDVVRTLLIDDPAPASPPPAVPPPIVSYAAAVEKPPRTDHHTALETTIGLTWTGWVGAMVLVIGAALGIKYGYDQSWFSVLPKEIRLGFCFAAGLALLGLGEWIDRRVNRISAAGVFASGIATLFVVSYAGFGYFDLYAQTTAFVLMFISTIVGSVLAVRKNLVVIGTLSLLGGNIAPLILRAAEPRVGALLGYILALQAVALFLAGRGKGGKWWILRGFAVAMPALWTVMAYSQSQANLLLPLGYSIAYAVLLQGELLLASGEAATRERRLVGPTSILVNTLLTLSLLYGLQEYTAYARGSALLMLAACCFGTSLLTRGRREELRYSYRVQAALLVLVAVPVGLSGMSIMLAWAGLSLAYVAIGQRLGSDVGRRFGTVAWTLAVMYLGYWSQMRPGARELLWLDLPRYAWTAFALTGIGHVLTGMLKGHVSRERIAVDIVASVVFVIAAMAGMTTWHATAAILGYAWALFAAGRILRREGWELHAAALLVLALVKWSSVDVLMTRLAPTAAAGKYLPVLNPIMAIGTALAGSIVGMYALQCRALEERLAKHAGRLAVGVATLIVAIMTFGLSVEVASVASQAGGTAWPATTLRQMGWTMLWTAAVAVHAGLIVKLADRGERRDWFGLTTVLMSIVAIKFLVVDVLLGALHGSRWSPQPIANLQTLACLLVVAGLGFVGWLRDREGLRWALGGALAILLVVGTVEIGRTFDHLSRTGMIAAGANLPMHVAISIYWAVFGVSAVVAGFRFRVAGLRYAGLALLAIALMKVVGFDLRELDRGYRILSFLGLGGLLLATSVIYGKLSPVLLRKEVSAG